MNSFSKLVFTLTIVFIVSSFAKAQSIDKIIAIVNNEPLLESDFKQLKSKINRGAIIDDSLLIDFTSDQLKTDRGLQLKYLVSEKILDSEIKRLNLAVTNEAVEHEMKEMAKRNNVGLEELTVMIKQQGMDVSEYKIFLKTKMERQNLMQSEIISKLKVSDEDAWGEYLRSNPGANPSVSEFSLAHIFFNPKKGGLSAAEDRAKIALDKLNSGEKFEELAEQFSEDPNFSSGGALGTFKAGEFLPEVERAIVGLSSGQVTKVIKSKLGLHIVKVLSKKNTVDPKFEKQKEKIKSEILEKNFKRQFGIWIQNKKDDAYIKYNE